MSAEQGPANSGKYAIVRSLGRGGMGEVYLGRDQRLNRDVAIKVMRGDLPEGNWQQRLQREAQLLAQLNHPNIVQIYDIIEHGGHPALVMEYVDGRNLHIYLREHRVELGEKLRWLSEISAGLAASHAAGIVHCDLKPENVLIDHRGSAKVTDFGIASSSSDSTGDMLALGILAEQLLAEHGKQLPPAIPELLQQLQQASARKRPDSSAAAEIFRLAWHENSQDETQLPVDLLPEQRKSLAIPVSLLAVIALALLATVYYSTRDAQKQYYVAIMPTVLKDSGAGAPRQHLYLRSSVQQALQQSVIESPELSLISYTESATTDGSPAERLAALGADALVSSSLDCRDLTCELSVERLDAPDGAVSQQQAVTLLVGSPLASHDSVQRQWHLLFPAIKGLSEASSQINEEQYQRYLELSLATDQLSRPSNEILEELDSLLLEAEGFLPLYLLYSRVVTSVYENMGDTAYLDKLEGVLAGAENSVGGSLFMLEARFLLDVRRNRLDEAAAILETVKRQFGNEGMTAFLTAELLFEEFKYDEAERYYARAVALQPSEKHIYARARNLFFGGKGGLALDVLDQLLERNPYHTAALGLKGVILMEQGRLGQSIETLERSLAIQPDPLQRANLGTAYMFQGNYQGARDLFDEAYRQDSRDSVMVLNLADAESLLGNTDRAQALYRSITRRAAEGDPSVDASAAAQAYAQLGEFEQALSVLREQKTHWDDSPIYAFGAALVYTLAGQNIAALVEVDRVLSSGAAAYWFNLPWFDELCTEDRFKELMAGAGSPGRCG